MAKPVTFGAKTKPSKKSDPFPFGLNVMSGKEKKAFRKQLKKGGHSGGGS